MKKINVSERMKNVAKITSGTMMGQLVSIITLPIYTRIFGAAIIGDWTLFTAISTIVITFSDLGLTNAIMIEEEEKSSMLYNVVTTISLIISIITGAITGIYYFLNPSESGISYIFFAVFLAILVFTQQQTQICYTWLNRKKKYNILMKNQVINNSAAAVLAVPLGLLGLTKYGYYVGLVFGQVVTLVHMKANLPKYRIVKNLKIYKKVIIEHTEFVKFQMPNNIIAQIKNQLPVLLIKAFFGSEILGYYSVSMKVLKIPVTYLGNSIGKVYYQTIAEMKKRGENIGEYTYKNIVRAMKIGILPMCIVLGAADLVCVLFLGNDYIVAGKICRIVVFNSFFTFLMTATQGITIVLMKQKYAMISGTAQLIGYFIGLSIGYYMNSIYVGCFIMTVVYSIAQIVYFSFMFKFAGASVKKYIRNVFISMLVIFVGAAIIRLPLIWLHLV